MAQRLAERLGLAPSLMVCLGQLYERWDGAGRPRGLKGDEVAPAVLVVSLAQDAVIWYRLGGADAAVNTARQRSGGAYDPAMAERFCAASSSLLAGLDTEPTLQSVLALEPAPHHNLDHDELDRCCAALADFADIKSPYTLGHSSGVAALAFGAGRRTGLIDADATTLRRGLTNREMAERLHVSPDTIKHHVGHIYDKIGCSTRAGATLFATEQSLL